jgi:hypothetical protein
VIGQRLIPRLVQAGHVVGGLTRSPSKTELLSHLGAEPILCDVFDREALVQAVSDFKPDVMLNELTDLPDDAAQISELADLNARIRTEGTRNLIEAARRSGSPKILAQSVAWQLPDGPDARAVVELELRILGHVDVGQCSAEALLSPSLRSTVWRSAFHFYIEDEQFCGLRLTGIATHAVYIRG